MPENLHWIGTWTAAPAPGEAGAISNQTLRMNPRVSIGGDRVRVRISNAYGTRPLLVGAAWLGLRDKGPAVMPDSHRKLTFGGAEFGDDRGRFVPGQRPGRVRSAAARRHRRQHLPAGRPAPQLRNHRPLRAADELHFPAGQLRELGGDAGGQHYRRVVFRQWRRRAGLAGDGRGGRARRFVDRRQYFDDGRLLPVARPARPPAACQARRPADGGDEPGARRQPDPARYPRRQRVAPLRPRCHRRSPASRT